MFLLGHTGLSVLAAYVAERTLARLPESRTEVVGRSLAPASGNPGRSGHPLPLARVSPRIDYRLVLIGAMLPDIIDKPLALWDWPSIFESSRAIGHSALFSAVLLVIAALVLSRSSRAGLPLLLVVVASTDHLVMDRMWESTETLWWPFLGWDFSGGGSSGPSIGNWLDALRNQPAIYVPEFVGALVLGTVATALSRRKAWAAFLGRGQAR